MKEEWKVRYIREISLVIAGQSPEGKYYNDSGDGLPFYQGKKEFGDKYLGNATTWTTKITKIAEPFDILMSVRAPVGTINIAPVKICIGRGLAAIRPFDGILDKYFLYYYLLLKEDEIIGKEGAVFPSINKKEIEEISIPIPPLSEQQRIVEILDNAFAKIDTVKQNAEHNRDKAKELFQSVLAFELSPKFHSANLKIGDVCSEIFAGGDAPSNYSEFKTEDNNIPIFANAVKDRGLYGYTNYARVTAPSITIAARGSGTGHVELRKEPFLPIVRLIVLIPNTEIVILEYLKYCIGNLQIMRSGSAIPQLTVPMIKGYMLHIPSLSEQQQIVSKLDVLSEKCKELENNYQQTINDCDELKKAILAKAFNGEL